MRAGPCVNVEGGMKKGVVSCGIRDGSRDAKGGGDCFE